MATSGESCKRFLEQLQVKAAVTGKALTPITAKREDMGSSSSSSAETPRDSRNSQVDLPSILCDQGTLWGALERYTDEVRLALDNSTHEGGKLEGWTVIPSG